MGSTFTSDLSRNSNTIESNKSYSNEKEITSEHCSDDNKIYSEDGECLFEDSGTISDSESVKTLIDFEEMIDSSRTNNSTKTLANIKEFEEVLQNLDTAKLNIDENIIDLDEMYDIFNENNSECDLNSLNISDAQKISSSTVVENALATSVAGNSILNIDESAIASVHVHHEENSLIPKENDVTTENYKEIPLKIVVNDLSIQETNANLLQTEDNDIATLNSTEIPKENDIRAHFDEVPSENKIDVSTNFIDNEIIEISSSSESDDNDGYKSSDFEFISETEANMDGFIINFRPKDTIDTILDRKYENPTNVFQNHQQNNLPDFGEGPSGLNRTTDDIRDTYRQNHVIPEGDDFVNLFQGPFNPVMPVMDIIILENKSVRPSPMNVQYEGMGFDNQLMMRRPPDSSEDEYADEAKENVKMILDMYPGENRKRRRRF